MTFDVTNLHEITNKIVKDTLMHNFVIPDKYAKILSGPSEGKIVQIEDTSTILMDMCNRPSYGVDMRFYLKDPMDKKTSVIELRCELPYHELTSIEDVVKLITRSIRSNLKPIEPTKAMKVLYGL